MRLFRLSVVSLGLLSATLMLAACANTKPVDETASWSLTRLSEEARNERNAGNFDKSVLLLEKLEARAAGTELAEQAQLDKAYTLYKSGEPAQALNALERFIRLHPSSPALDYALYLKGLSSFNDNLGLFGSLSRQDLSERDQKAAKQSFESFRDLINRFPDSAYSADARARMTHIVNSLARYEVHVARYYHQRGAHLAAIARAQTALEDYPQTPAQEEALFILMRAYDALGMAQLRDDTRRILVTTYPSSTYLRGFESAGESFWKLW
ncbi:MAG: outer rane assembly lipoYfiO family protein [Pseudomonadota bacterium]|jgi:outer membrane protein assembly factor BamD